MKGAPGLILALVLGLAGVALNWLYLQNKAKQVESISFLGIRDDATILVGQAFTASDLVEVPIPKIYARGLEAFVYLYGDETLIVGTRATRKYEGGELLWREDYRTPPNELKLGKDKLLMWVNVDSTSFVSDLVDPGDKISFMVPVGQQVVRQPVPTPATDEPAPAITTEPIHPGTDGKLIGPFEVAAVGNRLASMAVSKASQLQSMASNVLGIYVDNIGTEKDPKFDTKAAELNRLLQANPNLRARVIKHPKQ